MESTEHLDAWMDQSIVHQMELTGDSDITSTVETHSKIQAEEQNLSKDENLLYDKEQNLLSDYFTRLGEEC